MGLWSDRYSLASGALYSEAQHPSVILEKEYLRLDSFDKGTVDAWFSFYNTGSETVTIEAGFPIELVIDFDHMVLSKGIVYNEGDGAGIPVLAQPVSGIVGKDWPYDYLKAAGISVNSAVVDDLGEKTGYILESDLKKGRVEISADPFARLSLLPKIEQDGKPIIVRSVVVEKIPGVPYVLRFHYRYSVTFTGKSRTVVHISYPSDLMRRMEEGPGGRRFTSKTWRYVLYTGATWNGLIGDLIFALPAGATLNVNGWESLGFRDGMDIYRKVAFEPGPTEMITSTINEYDMEDSYESDNRLPWSSVKKMPGYVADVSASSWIRETGESFLRGTAITGAPFTPFALFDGIRQTAWCEGVKGDGIGEFVSFAISSEVTGFRIQNGYVKALFKTQFDGDKQQYYYMNNRPKELLLMSQDKQFSYTILLTDTPDDWQYFPVRLVPGNYTLTIRSVYKGTKWDDTCLGEIEFSGFPVSVFDRYKNDLFFGEFFR